MMKWFWAFVVIVASFGALADIERDPYLHDRWIYSAPGIPLGSFPDCRALAQDVAVRLGRVTGYTLNRPSGVDQGRGRCLVLVPFFHPKDPTLVSTNPKGGSHERYNKWNYTSVAACEADLPGQRALFENQTGLPAVVAYCYPALLSAVKPGVILKIESFGFPKRWPRYVGLPRTFEKQSAVVNSVAAAITRQGGVISRVALVNPWLSHSYDTLFFYSDQSWDFWKVAPDGGNLWFRSLSECESQIPEALRIVAATGSEAVTEICVNATQDIHEGGLNPHLVGPYRMEAVAIRRPLGAKGYYAAMDLTYPDINSCNAEKTAVFAEELRRGVNARGIICSKFYDKYRPVVIWIGP